MKKLFPYLCGCVAAALTFLPAASSGQTTIFFEDFENIEAFSTNWVNESSFEEEDPILWGVVNKAFGGEDTRSGTNKLYCAARGYWGTAARPVYPDNTDNYFEREVDLTNYKTASLSFWYKLRIFPGNDDYGEEFSWDYFTVYVNDDAVFSTDYYETDEPQEVTKWTRKTIDLTPYAGGPCVIRFGFISDQSSQENEEGGNTAGEGVYLDDILLTGTVANRIDLDDDGPDIVLQHTDSRVVVWKFSEIDFTEAQWLNEGKKNGAWKVFGQTDFDNDGFTDLFWYNPSTGTTRAWFMVGEERVAAKPMRKRGPGWKVGAMADFNADGTQDIVWQRGDGTIVVWYMSPEDPTVALTQAPFTKGVGTAFNVVGAGNFNGDAHNDLILQDKRTGTIRVRYLRGLAPIQATDPLLTLAAPLKFSTAWRVAGTQDMNADGQADLIMHHTNGTIAVWYVDGLRVTGQSILRKAPLAFKVNGHR